MKVWLKNLRRWLATFAAVCMLGLPGTNFALAEPFRQTESSDAMQAAQILGITDETNRLLTLKASGDVKSEEALELRSKMLQRLLVGCLDVRKAFNKIDVELAYTYDIMQRQQRRENLVNLLFNLANFVQLGTALTLEGGAEMKEKFIASSDITCISAGLGLTLPVMNILYGKFARARHIAPPKFLVHVLDGGPVDSMAMPQYVSRYMNLKPRGSSQSRRDAMLTTWKMRYGEDLGKSKRGLYGLTDGKGLSTTELNNRIVLLWNLRTFVGGFDQELCALLNLIKSDEASGVSDNLPLVGLSADANEAARLLQVGTVVDELLKLQKEGNDRERATALHSYLLERVLSGLLDVRMSTDKIYEELNYAYDVELAQLRSHRGRLLQKNFELNFVQSGTMGAIAGLLYLKNYTFAANELFVISSAIGTGQSTLSLLLLHGGWRKNLEPPNSLADFFDLGPKDEYRFSPLISAYLNSVDPQSSAGTTRKDELKEMWRRSRVATVNLSSKKEQERVAGMPQSHWDTIKILTNRIALLQSLRVCIESFDNQLLDLLLATQAPVSQGTTPMSIDSLNLGKSAKAAAELIGVESQMVEMNKLSHTTDASRSELTAVRLALVRRVLSATLETRATAANIGNEIVRESQALEVITRRRDLAVALTNNANFFQLGILGMISDGPLGNTNRPQRLLNGQRLQMITGLLSCGLASASFLEHFGGLRHSKSEPNMLGACLGIENSASAKYYPLLTKFLNSESPISPNRLTRKQELLEYWKRTNVLNLNVTRQSTAERLCASGKRHHFWNEDMRLVRNRVVMLGDLHAVVDLMNVGLSELLESVP